MLSTEEFKRFAGSVVLFLHNASRVTDEPYPNLLFEKGGNGFPTLSFLDHTGRLLTQQPYPTDNTAQLAGTMARLDGWKQLRRAVEGGTDKRRGELFLLELDFGMLEFAEGREQLSAVRGQLTKGQLGKAEQQLVDLQFTSVLRTVTRDEKTLIAAGEKFAAMIERERIPHSRQVTTFWQAALRFAEVRKDAGLFAKIFARAKREMAGDPRAERYMQSVAARLKRLQSTSGPIRD